jgi:hypothetical protein
MNNVFRRLRLQLWFTTLLCSSVFTTASHALTPQLVYRMGFDKQEELAQIGTLPAGARISPLSLGTNGLYVERNAQEGGSGSTILRLRLPLSKLQGCRVRCEAYVRAENVAKPPNPWNGVKVTLHTISPDGSKWSQKDNVYGSFDWMPIRFTAVVPQNASEIWLMLGLEQTTGKVWFDDVAVYAYPRPKPISRTGGSIFKGHSLPRLRGVMIGTEVGEADLRFLAENWNANHVRWQLVWGGFPRSPADKANLPEYDKWLEGELRRLDSLLPVCEELGLKVLIDLHTPPGGRDDSNVCRIFQDAKYQRKFIEVWRKIVQRCKNSKAVWGYDLVNEPVEGDVPPGLMDWWELALRTAQMIRSLDSKRAIVVEPEPWGSPESLIGFAPLPVKGVVYSVHMYLPFAFTHQGVFEESRPVWYPGEIDGVRWDKEQIRKALKPVVDFQKEYRVHIYIGEFSAIRWAPGESAYRYLSDVIDVFEENGWDWAYHAFREWHGWSVEHGSDPKDINPSPKPTDREKLLRRWFAKNVRPKAKMAVTR